MRISDWSSDVCSSDLCLTQSSCTRELHQQCCSLLPHLLTRRQIPSFCALQANRGQAATVICARVDSNTVGVLVHFQHDRVAMHHDLAFVRLPRRQELVTDPAQILRVRKSTRMNSNHSCPSRMPS